MLRNLFLSLAINVILVNNDITGIVLHDDYDSE